MRLSVFSRLTVSLVFFFSIVSHSHSSVATTAQCTAAMKGGVSAAEILAKALATSYNMFPISVGGVKSPSVNTEVKDYVEVSNPICTCLVPFPRIGITISLWEPISMIEVTAFPMCFPSLGIQVPAEGMIGMSAIGTTSAGDSTETINTYQAHYIKYPIFFLLGLFLDLACLDFSGIAIAWLTEVDPTWQNDMLAAFMHPEVFLVANPIAQAACLADAVTAQVGFPLDLLWWCFGAWGSAYPFSQNVGQAINVTSSANIAARTIFKMHRQLMLWSNPTENVGLCRKIPLPFMRKKQYGIFPIYPRTFPFRFVIGKTPFWWGTAMDMPFVNFHVWVWNVYSKRTCCFL